MRSKAGLFFLTILFASHAHAQAIVTPIINYVTPLIFVILSGIVLAIGFQLFLSVLSIASGVSLMGNVESRQKNAQQRRPYEAGSVIRRITTGMGLWSVITVSASLFVATVLSVRLSLLAGDGWIGIALGLVIWAAFFTLIVYFETKSATTLIGGIASTAIVGFRSGIEGMKGMFGPPSTALVGAGAKESTEQALTELRSELTRSEGNNLNDRLERLWARQKHAGLDYDRLRNSLADFLSDLSSKEKINVDDTVLDRKTVSDLAASNSRFSRRDSQLIGRAFDDARWIAQSRKLPAERGVQERVENYLRNTRRDALIPERMRADLDRIFSEPSIARDLASSGSGHIDHGTLVAVLEARRDLDHDRAERIANYAENAVSSVLNRISPGSTATDARSKDVARERLQARITVFLNEIDRPDFEYDTIVQEFEDIFREPKTAPEALRQMIQNYDRDSSLKFLETNENLSRDDVNRIVAKIDQAREKALTTMDRVEKKIQEKTEEAKAKALHQAELVREATAASAWWLFATASCSGIAAVIGGIIAVRP